MKVKSNWPFTYLANRKTKEIHKIKRINNRCGVEKMSADNAIYCTRLWAWFLIKFRKYNGCRWCWPAKDTG